MDKKLWQDYLHMLEGLTKTIRQLTEVEKGKTVAVTQGRLEDVETAMRREQALSLSLRGFDQKREAMLSQLGLTGVPLSRLADHAPDELLMDTKRVSETLRGEYEQFQTASQVARNTLECNLRAIEKLRAQAGEEPAPPKDAPQQPSQYDLRA